MPVPELKAKCSLRVFPAGLQEPWEQGLGLTAARGRAGTKQSEAPQEVGPAPSAAESALKPWTEANDSTHCHMLGTRARPQGGELGSPRGSTSALWARDGPWAFCLAGLGLKALPCPHPPCRLGPAPT